MKQEQWRCLAKITVAHKGNTTPAYSPVETPVKVRLLLPTRQITSPKSAVFSQINVIPLKNAFGPTTIRK